MARLQGWEGTHPEVGEHLQIDEYDAEVSEVFESERWVIVEVFYDNESELRMFNY